MPVLFLTEEDVRKLLTMDMALEAVELGLRKLALDEAVNIPRSGCKPIMRCCTSCRPGPRRSATWA